MKMGKLAVKKNMGPIDRAIRILTGLAMLYLGFIDQTIIDDAAINLIVGIFGFISIAFAYISFCPIYTLGNISTLKNKEENG